MVAPINPTSTNIDEAVADFEHEYDVLTEKLQITKPVFDGRLGGPSQTLKLALTRFFKHRLATITEEAEYRSRLIELDLFEQFLNLNSNNAITRSGLYGYKIERLRQLTERYDRATLKLTKEYKDK